MWDAGKFYEDDEELDRLLAQREPGSSPMPEPAPQPRRVVAPAEPQPSARRVQDLQLPELDQDALEQARDDDADVRFRQGIAEAGRRILEGLTHKKIDPYTSRPPDAESKLVDSNRAARAEAMKRLELEMRGEKYDPETEKRRLDLREKELESLSGYRDRSLDTSVDQKEKDRQARQESDRLKGERAAAAAKIAAAKAAKAAEEKKAAGGLKTADELRKEYNALPEVKDYKDVDTAVKKVEAAAKDVSAAGDLALIYAYMRVLDPGSSVKEGEFQAAAQAGGAGDRLVASIGKAMSGERLSPDQRADFLKHAQTLREAQRSRAEGAAKKYRGLATKRGADPNDVVEEGEANPTTVQMRFPDGSVHPVPQDKLDAARRKGGVPVH